MPKKNFIEIYQEIVNYFPPETDDPRLRYCRRTWIFPNHINIAIRFVKKLAKNYKANEEICLLGVLLHDIGLVYKRETASPSGHEERSQEFAQKFLSDHEYSAEVVKSVKNCIAATELEIEPKTMEEKVTRTADALAHMLSVHYFAKVNFSDNWQSAINFLDKKIDRDWRKICLPAERKKVQKIYDYLRGVVDQYKGVKDIDLWQE